MQVWNVLHVARWKYRMQKIAKNSPSGHHHTTLSGCIFATKACIGNRGKSVKQQYVLHMSSQYGELRLTNGWHLFGSLSTPANFNGFRVLPSLLQRRRSLKANQTLHDVWPSPGLVHYIYIFGGSCPLTEFCPVQNSLYVQVLHCPILAALLCTPLQQRASAEVCGVVQGMESQRAPPTCIFGWAAIALGIGPHF